MTRRDIAIVGMLVLFATVLGAQEKPAAPQVPAKVAELAAALTDAPVISELVAAKLDRFLLEIDNRRLRIDLLQAELTKIQADAQAFALTLQRPGYALSRQVDGSWVYTTQAAAKPASPEKK